MLRINRGYDHNLKNSFNTIVSVDTKLVMNNYGKILLGPGWHISIVKTNTSVYQIAEFKCFNKKLI